MAGKGELNNWGLPQSRKYDPNATQALWVKTRTYLGTGSLGQQNGIRVTHAGTLLNVAQEGLDIFTSGRDNIVYLMIGATNEMVSTNIKFCELLLGAFLLFEDKLLVQPEKKFDNIERYQLKLTVYKADLKALPHAYVLKIPVRLLPDGVLSKTHRFSKLNPMPNDFDEHIQLVFDTTLTKDALKMNLGGEEIHKLGSVILRDTGLLTDSKVFVGLEADQFAPIVADLHDYCVTVNATRHKGAGKHQTSSLV